jgi:copper chaperone
MKEHVVIDVQGMTCMGCVRSVTRVLEGVQGVASAQVSLEHHEAKVDFDPAKTSVQALRQAVIDAGYESKSA